MIGVERRAQFVTDGGEECRLGTARALGVVTRQHQLARALLHLALEPAPMVRIDVQQRKYQQGQRAAGDEDQPGLQVGRTLLEPRTAAEPCRPLPSADLEDDIANAECVAPCVRRGVEQPVRYPGAAAIEHLHLRSCPAPSRTAAIRSRARNWGCRRNRTGPHAVRPGRRVAVRGDRRAGRSGKPGCTSTSVSWTERDLARQRGPPRVARALHRLAPHGLGIHVVAEGAQVAPREGLEVDDGAVGVAISGRRIAKCGKPSARTEASKASFPEPGHHDGEPGALDSRQ